MPKQIGNQLYDFQKGYHGKAIKLSDNEFKKEELFIIYSSTCWGTTKWTKFS